MLVVCLALACELEHMQSGKKKKKRDLKGLRLLLTKNEFHFFQLWWLQKSSVMQGPLPEWKQLWLTVLWVPVATWPWDCANLAMVRVEQQPNKKGERMRSGKSVQPPPSS